MAQSPDNRSTAFVSLAAQGPDHHGAGASGRQVVLVPGAAAPIMPLDLPSKLRGLAREQVARRQVRDVTGLGEDQLQMRPFVLGKNTDAWTHALVVDPAQVANWRRAAGPKAQAVLPDYLALPIAETLWSLHSQPDAPTQPDTTLANTTLANPSMLSARLGLTDGFSAHAPLSEALLKQALVTHPAPRVVLWQGPQIAQIAALFAAKDIPIVDTIKAAQALIKTPIKVLGYGEPALDLRRDSQAARQQLARRVLPWRWPVMAGLLAAALWGGTQWQATQRLQADIQQLAQETQRVLRRDFVPTGPILDSRTQVMRALQAARAQANPAQPKWSPLELLGRTAEVLAQYQATPQQFSLTESGLQAILHLPDFATVDQLQNALANAQVHATIQDSRARVDDRGTRDGTAGVVTTLLLKAQPDGATDP